MISKQLVSDEWHKMDQQLIDGTINNGKKTSIAYVFAGNGHWTPRAHLLWQSSSL